MNRMTLLADIAGRVSLDTGGSPCVTAAAIAIPSNHMNVIAAKLPNNLPKWQSCTREHAEAVVNLLTTEASAIGVFIINKDTAAWPSFWKDMAPLQSAIVKQDRRPAGFVRPANMLSFLLLGGCCAIAMSHALMRDSRHKIVNDQGNVLVERTVICDSDIQGDENLDAFRSAWTHHDEHQPLTARMGFRVVTREVRVTTEQDEPLLLLADYAAGITHIANLKTPGRIPLPLPISDARKLLALLDATGKLVVHTRDFDVSYKKFFGDGLGKVNA